jgi:hypothetical protein
MYNLEKLVNTKLHNFVEISGQTADIISMHEMRAVGNYDLKTKIIGISANITNINFGCVPRMGKENVLTKI